MSKKRNYKIFSISDIHLRTLKGHETYKIMFDNVIKALEKEKPDYFILNGDLFHQKLIISNEANVLMGDFLSRCVPLVKQKIIINIGNHDFVIGSERVDCVTPIVKILNDDKIVLFNESGCFKTDDNNIVWCVWSLFTGNRPPSVKEWKEKNDPNGENIYVGLYHGIVSGSKTKTHTFDEDDGLSLGDPDVFELDHLNCGDIHLAEKRTYDNYKGTKRGLYIMNSSTIQQDFGEYVDNHGYNVLFYDAGSDLWEHDLIEIENEYTYNILELKDYDELEKLSTTETISEKASVRVDWIDKRENFSKDKEKEIIKFIKHKYNLHQKNVKVSKIPTNSLKLGAVDLSTGESENINSPVVQERMIVEYLKENKIQIEPSDIKRLNKRVEGELNEVDVKDNKWSIKNLTLTNFLSYGDDTTFNFDKLNGITLITGENFVGKTTVIHALTWLLFGVTDKVKTMEGVINKFNGATSAKVEGELLINGVEYKIIREVAKKYVKKTNSYNGVSSSLKFMTKNEEGVYEEKEKEEDRKATEKVIKEYIGNIDDFLMTIICTGSNIFDIIETQPTERGEMMSRYLGLEIFKRKLDKVKEIYKNWKIKADVGKYTSVELQLEIDKNKETITNIQTENVEYTESLQKHVTTDTILNGDLGKLMLMLHKDIDEDLSSHPESYFVDKINEADSDVKNKKVSLNTYQAKYQSNLKNFDEETYNSNLEKIKTLNDVDINNIKESKRKKENEISAKQSLISNLETENKFLNRDMDILRETIKTLKQGGICPECKQKLSDVDHSDVIKEKIALGVAKKSDLTVNEGKKKAIELEIEEIKKDLPSFDKQIDAVNVKIDELKKANEVLYKDKELITANDLVKINIDKTELQIEIAENKLKNEQLRYEKYKADKDKIVQNHETKLSINNKKMEITENDEKVTLYQTKISALNQKISDLVDRNEELDLLITKIRKEEHTAKVFDVYIDMVGKDGISKSILKSSVPILNLELSRLLSDSAEFTIEIEINEKNNNVEFWYVDNETGIRNYLNAGSGYEKTIASLAIRIVNSKINCLPKPSLLVMDEIFGTVTKSNLELVKSFIDKVSANIDNIILITHEELTKEWADNIVTVTKENHVTTVGF